MKGRVRITEDAQLWAVAVIRLWVECPHLRREFDSICDFETWGYEISESLIRSADGEGEK